MLAAPVVKRYAVQLRRRGLVSVGGCPLKRGRFREMNELGERVGAVEGRVDVLELG